MVASSRRQHLTAPIAPLGGAVLGLAAGLALALIPAFVIEDFMLASGLPQILPAAAPPLGLTARLGLVLVAAGSTGLLAWFMLFLAIGTRAVRLNLPQRRPVAASSVTESSDAVPVLRRADAHPDAPARRPLFANSDLGTPFLDVHAASEDEPTEDVDGDRGSFAQDAQAAVDILVPPVSFEEPRALPDDLNVPLSSYGAVAFTAPATDEVSLPTIIESEPDPVAAPLPMRPVRPQVFEPGERFETFDLRPLAPPPAAAAPVPVTRDAPLAQPSTDATIAALLERLERTVAARTPRVADNDMPARPLDATLGALRQMATRAG